MEIHIHFVVVAESNIDLRRAAFKRILDQFLRVVHEESNSALVIPIIKAIGSLVIDFSEKVLQVLGPLVAQLGNKDVDIANDYYYVAVFCFLFIFLELN